MNKEKRNIDQSILDKYEHCIFLNKLGLKLMGIWPIKANASRSRLIFRKIHLIVVYLILFSVLIPQWYDIYYFKTNLDAVSETFLSNVFILGATIKHVKFLISVRTFEEIVSIMRSNWIYLMKGSSSKRNKDIMYDWMVTARDHSAKYGAFVAFTAVMFYVKTFVNTEKESVRDRHYPFFGRYYFDRDSDLIYTLCYLNQVLMSPVVGITNYATDGIFMLCMYHFCAQLQILQNDIMDLNQDLQENAAAKVVEFVRRHQTEIANARKLQLVFGLSGLQQIIGSCLLISMNSFKLIDLVKRRDIECLIYLSSIPLMFVQILFYCQPGNELMVQSEMLHRSIYLSHWVSIDPVSKRHLMFMIQKSQDPLSITAGKIYVLSLENFMRIVKTALSALSVLQAMQNDD